MVERINASTAPTRFSLLWFLQFLSVILAPGDEERRKEGRKERKTDRETEKKKKEKRKENERKRKKEKEL